MTRRRRETLSDKLPDLANLVIGALWFGQLLSDRPFSWALAAGGAAGYLLLMGSSLYLGDGDDDD